MAIETNRNAPNSPWNFENRVERLKALWAEGFSASQIAERLGGVTRNAVISKVHRLGLSGRVTKSWNKPGPKPAPSKPRRSVQPVIPREVWTPTPEIYTVPPEKRVGVDGLTDNQCRWPIGDPQDDNFHFCNQEKVPGLPYCAHHCTVAFEPSRPRKRRTNRVYTRPKLEVVNGS